MNDILRSLIRETLLEAKTHMGRFICPKHSVQLKSAYKKDTHQRFWGCPFWKDGCDYTVEGDPPHRAYGEVARSLMMPNGMPYYGQPQEIQSVPTKRYSEKLKKTEAYEDLLRMNHKMSSNIIDIKKYLLPQVHKLGLKKKSARDIADDIEIIMSKGKLA